MTFIKAQNTSDKIAEALSTFFYAGRFPAAPGSFTSALTLLLCVFVLRNPFAYLVFIAVVTFLGFQSAGVMERVEGKEDPSCVVIDEVAGMAIALFMIPVTWATAWTAFFLFRAFDMFKIYPTNKMEKLGGATGIMMDDIIAGIYTNITLHIALKIVSVI